MLAALAIAALTAAYMVLGRAGMSRLREERKTLIEPSPLPMVSVIIPAYDSQKTISDALKSARALDYPRKEIIVVNDSPDSTPAIARSYGARVIQNRSRTGKPASLNRATEAAKGELLFVLDADTAVSGSALRRLVPWFSKSDVAAVMPRYSLKNRSRIAGLASMENSFTFALLRVHAFLRGTVGFRGCSVVIRRDLLKKHPWPETLMEDNHLSATLSSMGYRIIWEPLASTRTTEPETVQELKRQKRRWGEGAYLAFRKHWRFYMKSPQFLLFFLPYFILGIFTALLLIAFLLSPLLFPALSVQMLEDLVMIFVAMYFHTLIFLYLGGGKLLPLETMRFMLFYFPLATVYYFRGMLSGIKRRRRGRAELHFRHW